MSLSSDDLQQMREKASGEGNRARAVVIDKDLACVKCGYNLRGLPPGGRCPECGRPFAQPRKSAIFGDQMAAAPLRWSMTFMHGAACLALGATVIGLTAIASAFIEDTRIVSYALLIGGAACFWGAVLTTRPRPVTAATTTPPEQEWVWERRLGRWSQAAWVAGPVLMLASAHVSTGERVLLFCGLLVLSTAIIGMLPLMLTLSNLAYWAADTNLAQRLRISAWTLPASGLLAHALLIGGLKFWFGSLFGALAVLIVSFGVLILPLLYGWWSIVQLWSMSKWVVINHVTADMRDTRAREKFERERRMADHARQMAKPPGSKAP